MRSKLERIRPWLVPGLIFAVGVLLRIRSLWRSDLDIDEAWRALIVCGGPGNTAIPPTVPPLTLVAPRLAIALLGPTETSLRLLGFLCALGSMALVFLLARRIAGRTAAVLALVFLALQPEYVHYDAIFKQYPYEVFFGLALVVLAERVLSGGGLRDRLLFAATAVGGVFFATPLVHLYPAIFLVLAWREWKRSRKLPVFAFSAGAAALAASVVDYLVFLKPVDTGGLNVFWQEAFVSGGAPTSFLHKLGGLTVEVFRQFLYHPSGLLGNVLYRPMAVLFLLLTAAGLVRFIRSGKAWFAAWIVAPPVLLAAYSYFRLWPYGANRVNLFYFPFLMVAAAAGAGGLIDALWRSRPPGRIAAVVLAVVLTVPYVPARRAREFFMGTERLRPAIGRVLAEYREGDAVLTRDSTNKIFLYYAFDHAPFRRFRKDFRVFDVYHPWGDNSLERRRVPVAEIEAEVSKRFREHARIWLVFKWDLQALEEEAAILRTARRLGRQRWGMEKGFYKVLLFLPRRDLEPPVEPEDPQGAPDVGLPDERVEGQNPAEDEPGPEVE